MNPKNVLVPIADGTEELEAVALVDVLRRAGAQVTVASAEDRLDVTASRGIRLVAECHLHECRSRAYDLVAIPGGMPGSERLRDHPALTEILMEQARSGRWYAAICAAPIVVLQHHGLLRGRRATCHSSLIDRLENREAADQPVVVDGPCVTSRGPATALSFALKLVELLYGPETAQRVGQAMT